MKKWLLAVLVLGIFVLAGCAKNINQGVEAMEIGKYKEAKESFERQIKKGKHLDEAYRGLGMAHFELEEYEAAISAFELALKAEAEETSTMYNMMGVCYMKIESYEKALDVYKKALELEDISKETKQEMLYNLIAIYEGMADWESAKEQMRLYREAYPNDERVEKEADFLETR